MEAVENGLQRKIKLQGDPNPELLKRISELYNNKKAGSCFIGVFNDKLPADACGVGYYTRIENQAVTTHLYSESFGGDKDPAKTIDDIRNSVDKLVTFFCGWLDHEFGKDPDLKKFRDFCNGQLKKDTENFALYVWLYQWQAELVEDKSQRSGDYLGHFFIEHDYIELSDIMKFNKLNEADEKQITIEIICKAISKKSGLTEEAIYKKFKRFFDEKIFRESIKKYFKTTPEYKDMWEKMNLLKSDPSPAPRDFNDLLEHELDFHFTLWQDNHKIQIEIKCPVEPFETNGKWDANDLKVKWSQTINDNYILPAHLFCFWKVPNEKPTEENLGSKSQQEKKNTPLDESMQVK
jgi:hypothetical protein